MSCCHSPHKTPSFPVAIRIWHTPAAPPNPPSLTTVGSLNPTPAAIRVPNAAGYADVAFQSLYLPPRTDVRWASQGVQQDVIECPAGSGILYSVASVYDIARGFPNEFRLAVLYYRQPVPIPLP